MVAQVVLGIALLAGGVVLLFIPGPGLLLIVFGLAMVAGTSRTLAGLLDRAEPPARERATRAKRWWTRSPAIVKAGLVLVALAGAAAATYGMYRIGFA
jgi:hypothetical protein